VLRRSRIRPPGAGQFRQRVVERLHRVGVAQAVLDADVADTRSDPAPDDEILGLRRFVGREANLADHAVAPSHREHALALVGAGEQRPQGEVVGLGIRRRQGLGRGARDGRRDRPPIDGPHLVTGVQPHPGRRAARPDLGQDRTAALHLHPQFGSGRDELWRRVVVGAQGRVMVVQFAHRRLDHVQEGARRLRGLGLGLVSRPQLGQIDVAIGQVGVVRRDLVDQEVQVSLALHGIQRRRRASGGADQHGDHEGRETKFRAGAQKDRSCSRPG